MLEGNQNGVEVGLIARRFADALVPAITEVVAPIVAEIAELKRQVAAVHGRQEYLEDRFAKIAPGGSSGAPDARFLGRDRLTASQGEEIRAMVARGTPREDIIRTWCGRGFTQRQVAAALAHRSGGHRRRRMAATPTDHARDARA